MRLQATNPEPQRAKSQAKKNLLGWVGRLAGCFEQLPFQGPSCPGGGLGVTHLERRWGNPSTGLGGGAAPVPDRQCGGGGGAATAQRSGQRAATRRLDGADAGRGERAQRDSHGWTTPPPSTPMTGVSAHPGSGLCAYDSLMHTALLVKCESC